ncbi:MAG: 8-amino-7-oxononanoate synthase [Akkermansia sp.]|nr:8-amino-7-oxononanoate synthase [Akkermansia sp.]
MNLTERIETALGELEAAGNLRTLRTVVPEGIYLRHEGKRYLNLSSNDYLGLSASAYAGVDVHSYAARTWGQERLSAFAHGNPASRLMTGNSAEYDIVEEELEQLFPDRAALVLGCGFMANSGLMPALAEKGDLILADKLVHASIIEGLQHTNAAFRRFPHNDVAALEQQLQRAEAGQTVWVIIESLYSMDGDLAPLAEIVELKKKYGFYLYVDEAHSFGVRGPQGKGYAAELGLEREVDLMVVTFGKALAGAGAAVICSPLLRRWLINRMRPLIFSTALPPVTLLWDALVLHEMRTESLKGDLYPGTDSLRAHLAELIQEFSEASGIPAASHIIPIPCGSNERALAVAEAGRERELWLTAIRHPTVPQGTARIRLSLNAGMTLRDLSPLLDLCKKIG